MKRLFAVLTVAAMLCTSPQVRAQSGGFTFNTGPATCALGGPACNVPVDGGGSVMFRYTSNYYGNTINVWISTPQYADVIGPVPATLTQTVFADGCSVDSRYELDVPPVTVTDSNGASWTFSGTQYLSKFYTRGGGGRGGGGAGCHFNDLGNGSFTLTPVQ